MDRVHNHALRHRHSRREVAHVEMPSRTAIMERSSVGQLLPRSTCKNDDDAACRKPTETPAAAIAAPVIVLVVVAAIVFFFLHRRNVKKLREEDAKDKYKSMDFGLDEPGKKKGPEMRVVGAERGHLKGMSLDVGHNPYILPAGLNGSRESFHSLSRTITDNHDPYRPVTFIKSDTASVRSGGRAGPYRHDNESLYTTSSTGTDKEKLSSGLLKNAQRMSQSIPPRVEPTSPFQEKVPEIQFPEPVAAPTHPLHPNATLPPPPLPPVQKPTSPPPEPKNEYVAFKPTASPAEPQIPDVQQSKPPVKQIPSPPSRVESQQAVVQNANTASFMSDSSYGEGFKVTPPSPSRQHQRRISEEPAPLAPQPHRQPPVGLGVDEFGGRENRLSMSLRPLPPDDPTDNPEQRANRIRSFYKEYFDDSKPEPVGDHIYNDYVEDYGSEYLDGAMFDSRSNAFIVAQPRAPFAQPVTRRAMTPPPRAPPRFRSGSNPRGPGHMSGNTSMASSPGFPPRGMSAMSGRLPAPRKPLPPPSVLNSLPTPAKLTEESMMINPADFAPPVSIRDLQNGRRPDSPLGGARPYSPSVRPHTPLTSSFDDLMVMPSPHALRTSGTFTALDFAPPPRFRDPGSNASDAGSIRSNRSGMSAAGRMAIRNGANRVSRIPKGVVGTRDDILNTLRPTMDMTRPA